MRKFGKLLDRWLIYSGITLLFWERMILLNGFSSHGFVKAGLSLIMFGYLWNKRLEVIKKLGNNFEIDVILVYILWLVVNSLLSISPSDSFREVFFLLVMILLMVFIAIWGNEDKINKIVNILWVLSVVDVLVRLGWYFLGKSGDRLLPFEEVTKIYFGVHVNQKQLIYLSGSSVIIPLWTIYFGLGKFNRKWWMNIGLGLFLLGVFISSSRTYFLIVICSLVAMVFLIVRLKLTIKTSFFGLILITFLISGFLVKSNPLTRWQTTNWREMSGRKMLTEEMKMNLGNLIWTGVGLRNSGQLTDFNSSSWDINVVNYLNNNQLSLDMAIPSAHSLLNIMFETGIIGLILWLVVMGVLARKDISNIIKLDNSKNKLLFVSLCLSSWSYILICVFDEPSYTEQMTFWLLRGMLLSPWWVKQMNEDNK